MKFGYRLPVTLLAAVNVMMLHQTAIALQPSKVNAIAQKITVRISGPEPGTGVVVNKKGNTYTVLTNWHVVDTAGIYTIQTHNGGSYQVKSSQAKRLSGVDLALLQFQSQQNYQLANIGNSEQPTAVNPFTSGNIYAAGWADTDATCTEKRCYQFRSGNITTRVSNPKDGYAWIYSNTIKPGMSGGPVLNEQGELVAINGRGIRDPRTGRTDFFAIPINTYLKLAPAIAPSLSKINRFSLVKTIPSQEDVNTGHQAWIETIAFSPNSKMIAAGSMGGFSDKVWDVRSGKLLKTLTDILNTGDRNALISTPRRVSNFVFSPDSKSLAYGSNDNTIKIWDVATDKVFKTLPSEGEPKRIAFGPNGKTLAYANDNGSIRILDVTTEKLLKTLSDTNENSLPNSTIDLVFSPNGKILASRHNDDSLKIWDFTTGKLLNTITTNKYHSGDTSIEFSIAFSPSGKTLAFPSTDGSVKIWDVVTGKVIKTFGNNQTESTTTIAPTSITFSPSGKTLAFKKEGSIKILDVATGQQIKSVPVGGLSFGLEFSLDGKTLAAGSNKSIKIWNISGL